MVTLFLFHFGKGNKVETRTHTSEKISAKTAGNTVVMLEIVFWSYSRNARVKINYILISRLHQFGFEVDTLRPLRQMHGFKGTADPKMHLVLRYTLGSIFKKFSQIPEGFPGKN